MPENVQDTLERLVTVLRFFERWPEADLVTVLLAYARREGIEDYLALVRSLGAELERLRKENERLREQRRQYLQDYGDACECPLGQDAPMIEGRCSVCGRWQV